MLYRSLLEQKEERDQDTYETTPEDGGVGALGILQLQMIDWPDLRGQVLGVAEGDAAHEYEATLEATSVPCEEPAELGRQMHRVKL